MRTYTIDDYPQAGKPNCLYYLADWPDGVDIANAGDRDAAISISDKASWPALHIDDSYRHIERSA